MYKNLLLLASVGHFSLTSVFYKLPHVMIRLELVLNDSSECGTGQLCMFIDTSNSRTSALKYAESGGGNKVLG